MTQTRTIGEILKTERTHHQIGLEALSQKTRIKLKYLQALEENKFEDLPASAFVKGYIKTYAQIFNFKHQPLLAILRRDYKESARGKLVPREFIKPVLRKKRSWTPATATLATLGAMFILLASYVGFQYYTLQKPPFLQIDQPAEGQIVASQLQVSGQTVNDAVLTVNSQVVSLDNQGNFNHPIFLPKEGLNTIVIESTDRRGKKNIIQRTVRVDF